MARVCLALMTFAALLPFCGSPAAPAHDFRRVARVPAGRGPSALAAADVIADGLLDLLVGNETEGTPLVLLGDGADGFRSASGSPSISGPTPLDIAVGDFNRDGVPTWRSQTTTRAE